MKLFSLHLILNFIYKLHGISSPNLNLIDQLIEHYYIKDVYIITKDLIKLDNIVLGLRTLKNKFSVNIHTKDEMIFDFSKSDDTEYVECCELFLITIDAQTPPLIVFYWFKVANRYKAKLVAIISETEIPKSSISKFFGYSQIIIFLPNETIKFNLVANIYEPFTTIEEYIATDPYTAPELYLPKLNIKYYKFTMADFPLIVGHNDTPETGLVVYFTDIFAKYYKNILEKNNTNHSLKKRYSETLNVRILNKARDILKFPWKRSKLCFMLPMVDEISPGVLFGFCF